MNTRHFPILLLAGAFLFVSAASGQDHQSVKISPLAGRVFLLEGPGGNVAVLKDSSGLVVIDSKFAGTAPDFMSALDRFKPLPVRYLVNTHYHGDHTGGNPIIGQSATIIGHENCRSGMLSRAKPEEPVESLGLPSITFNKALTLRLADEIVHLRYSGPGHTSGDTVVVFEKAKVVHMGDLFFHQMPPYIDVSNGSDTKNWIAIIRKITEEFDGYTIIPGHGPVTDTVQMGKFADYLQYLRDAVAAAVSQGKTRQETIDGIDLTPYAHLKDVGEFLTRKNNVGWIYDEITKKQK
jgi:glyoxylase-like metal-dependent hydrolase (beta-lactamase superfamily II)